MSFACTSVTFTFTGFPDANGNTVTEQVRLNGVRILPVTTFTFDGPSGSNSVPIRAQPGHNSLDAHALWNTNGVKGGKDIPLVGGIDCKPPTVTSITPRSGTIEGGTKVTIRGSGFATGAVVTIGDEAGGVRVLSADELTATTPAHAAGAEKVIVSDSNGESSGGLDYTYVVPPPPPTVTSITPVSGTTAGGTNVTIKGSGFLSGAIVTIGGEAGEVLVLSEHELTATTAAHLAGSEEVIVSDTFGKSKGGPSYTYVAPPPQVTSITPRTGTTEGGTKVTIKGSGFTTGAVVTIGDEAGEVQVLSEAELTATTPAHAPASEEVIVTDTNGKSKGGPSYTFVAPPAPAGGGAGLTPGSGVLGTMTVLLAPPQLAVSGNLAPVSGTVLVQLPGSSVLVALTGLRQVPFGTLVNATHGKVSVTTASPHGGTQTIVYYDGWFRLTQGHSGLVQATLAAGDFAVCPTARERGHLARTSSKHSSRKHVVRKLWSEGHGSFSTKGSYAAGAVLGTRWLTEDLCDGTLIQVVTDRVAVTNLVNHRHITVTAGHSYLAKAP